MEHKAQFSLSNVHKRGLKHHHFISMEHILIHCAEYIDIRDIYFNVNTARELIDTVPPVLII